MISPTAYKLPSRYFPPVWRDLHFLGGVPTIDSNNLGTANKAFYVPVEFPVSVTLTGLHFFATNGTGNYDLGIYDEDLSARMISSGSTAMSAAGLKTLTIPDWRIKAGELIYAALTLSSTSGTVWRIVPGLVSALVGLGFAIQLTALPLPATATPVKPDNTIMPVMAFSLR